MKEATSAVEDDEDEDTITDRSVDACWQLYLDQRTSHTSLSVDELRSMMQSLIDAVDSLVMIDEPYYRLVSDNLRSRYYDLELLVQARGESEFPVLKTTPILSLV